MIEVRNYIDKLKKSEIPLSITTMEKMLIRYRRWEVLGWHEKRKFTGKAREALKQYAKTIFNS